MGNSAANTAAEKAAAKAAAAAEKLANSQAAAAAAKAAEELANGLTVCQSLSVATKETGISLVKKQVATTIDNDFRSLSAAYRSLLKNRDEAIRFLEVRGQKIEAKALHQILFAQNFKLFSAFLTEKQQSKSNFSGSEVLSILSRSVSTSKKSAEVRAMVPNL